MPGITNGHQNYEKCEKKRNGKWKVNQKISKTSNLWLKIGVFTIFSYSFYFSFYFPFTRTALEQIKLFSLWSKSLWPLEAKAIDVHFRICTYVNPWQLLLYLSNANWSRRMGKMKIWKICISIYLMIRRPGKFCASFFSCPYKHDFLFLHIWSIASGQLRSGTLLWCDRKKIGPNHENSVPCGSLSHFLVLDRFGGLIKQGSALFLVFNRKEMWV